MSVLINGMEMPKETYAHCMLIKDIDGSVQLHVCTKNSEDVSEWEFYDLVPVPPHGRLGDLDRLEQMFVDIDNAPYSGFDGEEPFYSAEDAAQIIRLAPTVIPASEEGET